MRVSKSSSPLRKDTQDYPRPPGLTRHLATREETLNCESPPQRRFILTSHSTYAHGIRAHEEGRARTRLCPPCPSRARHHHLSTPIHAVKWQKKGPGLRLDRIRGDNGRTDSRKSAIAVSPVPFELKKATSPHHCNIRGHRRR